MQDWREGWKELGNAFYAFLLLLKKKLLLSNFLQTLPLNWSRHGKSCEIATHREFREIFLSISNLNSAECQTLIKFKSNNARAWRRLRPKSASPKYYGHLGFVFADRVLLEFVFRAQPWARKRRKALKSQQTCAAKDETKAKQTRTEREGNKEIFATGPRTKWRTRKNV